MTIEFTSEQEQFIKQSLASGRYSNEAEVIREALALLQKQERELADMQGIFTQAHRRNTGLDVEATFDLIEQEVQAHRKGRKH
ncbi:MAG: ribbon-helix-helix domain-containing protein [Trueperaceae bacterium]